jgi:hypothetical protein
MTDERLVGLSVGGRDKRVDLVAIEPSACEGRVDRRWRARLSGGACIDRGHRAMVGARRGLEANDLSVRLGHQVWLIATRAHGRQRVEALLHGHPHTPCWGGASLGRGAAVNGVGSPPCSRRQESRIFTCRRLGFKARETSARRAPRAASRRGGRLRCLSVTVFNSVG